MICPRSGRNDSSAQPHQGRATRRGNRTHPADARVPLSSGPILTRSQPPRHLPFPRRVAHRPTCDGRILWALPQLALQRSLGSSFGGPARLAAPSARIPDMLRRQGPRPGSLGSGDPAPQDVSK